MTKAVARCFVALRLGDATEALLERTCQELARHRAAVKWVARSALHVTLEFLGEIPRGRVAEVEAALRAVPVDGPLRLRVQGLGRFPPHGAPRVLWAGLDGDVARLGALARRIAAALQRLGFARTARPFSPHLTIGRVKDPRGSEALLAALARGELSGEPAEVREVVLYESELLPQGPRYTALARLPLA